MGRDRMNGEHVSRAELAAHLERIDGSFASVHEKLDAIAVAVGAPRRWWTARFGAVLDRGLYGALVAVAVYFGLHG